MYHDVQPELTYVWAATGNQQLVNDSRALEVPCVVDARTLDRFPALLHLALIQTRSVGVIGQGLGPELLFVLFIIGTVFTERPCLEAFPL